MEHRHLALMCCLQDTGKHTDPCQTEPALASQCAGSVNSSAGPTFHIDQCPCGPPSLPLPGWDGNGFYFCLFVWWWSLLPFCPLPICSNLLLSCKLDFQPSLSQALPHLYTGGLGPGQIISHCLHVCYLGGTSDGQALLMLTWLHLALFFIYIYLLRWYLLGTDHMSGIAWAVGWMTVVSTVLALMACILAE